MINYIEVTIISHQSIFILYFYLCFITIYIKYNKPTNKNILVSIMINFV